MKTSIIYWIIRTLNTKAKQPFAFLTVLFLSTLSLFSQDYLIPTDAPNNKYPITFTDAAQQILLLEFDRAVTAPGTTAGWTITVGGAPVAMSGNPVMVGNFLRITLSSSISYANRNAVLVSYATSGTLSLTGPVEPIISNVQAINNYIAVAADFTNGLFGENSPKDICAAVEDVEVEFNFTLNRRFRNSIHYCIPKVWIQWEYPATFPRTLGVFTEIGVGTGIYRSVETYAGYPDNTLNCTWDVSIFPYLFNSGTLQPNLLVTQNTVILILPNYKKDNGTPVPGTGDLGIFPEIDHPSTLFCVGENITAFTFTDATVFDCQLAAEPDLPNINPRNVQFIYGTQTGNAIPNVFINVFGTPVQITDASGNPMPNSWTVNPLNGAAVPAYSTISGFFEGPVINYLWDPGTKTLITPLATTYPINHTGDFINDMENDIFDVTLLNWGPCNPYDAMDPFRQTIAVPEISRLRLVGAPPLPTASNKTVCYSTVAGANVLTAIRNGANPGELHWYNNSDLLPIHQVGVGSTYDPGIMAAGIYTYWVREIGTTGMFCEGPAEDVVLTINPIPDQPTITRDNPDFCFDGATAITLTADPHSPPVVSSYQWYRNGIAVGGATSSTLLRNLVAHSGSYTVLTYGIAPTNCPSPISAATTILIDQVPTATVGAAQNICGTVATSATLSGNTPAGGATGYWSYNVIWREDFNNLPNGTTVDLGPTAWSYTGVPTDWARVESKRFEAKETDNWIIWSSQVINISTYTNVSVVLRMMAGGTNDAGTDFMRVYYRLNGGAETALSNGLQTGNFGTVFPSVSGINGNTLQIVVRILNNSDNEYYYFDDLIVSEGGAAIITDPSNPTSTVTNLPLGPTIFTWTVTSSGGICPPAAANLTITRDGQPTSANAGPAQTFCEVNSTSMAANAADNGGTGTWTRISGTGTITSVNSPTTTITGLGYGPSVFRWTIASAYGICTTTQSDITITRNQNPDDKTISAAASPVCSGSSTNINVPSSQSGIRYDLYKTSGPTFVGSVNGNGGIVTVSTGALTASTDFYMIAVNTTTLCQRTLNTVSVVVSPATVGGSVTGGTTPICLSSGTGIMTLSGHTGDIQKWQKRVNAGGWTDIVNTSITYSEIPSSSGTWEYRAEVKSGVCGSAFSAPQSIVVDPASVGGAVSGGSSPICYGLGTGVMTLNGHIGSVVQWQKRVNASAWTNIANVTLTYSETPSSDGTWEYRAEVKSGNCASVFSTARSIVVNPLPTPSISGLNNVCAGQPGVTYTTAAGGGRSYAWTVTGGAITLGAGTNSITVTWGAAGAGTVSLIETILATSCAVTTPNYNVTINNGPPAAAPAFNSGQTERCLNSTLNLNVSDVATATQYIWDYSWVVGTNNATTAVSQIDIDLTGRPIGTYSVTVQAANGCGSGAWMAPVHSFDINDTPDLSPASANPCSDIATGINFGIANLDINYCSGITYNITAINFNGLSASAGAPATGTGFAANIIADDAWTNTTGANVNVVYTVVPVSSQGCSGAAENVTVTVQSEPLGANANISTCSNSALAYNIQTSNINVLPGNSQLSTFAWVAAANVNVTGESTTSQTTSIINDNLINTTNSSQTVLYTVTPTGTNLCAGNSFTVSVTVNPRPAVTDMTGLACSASSFTVTPVNVTNGLVPAGTTYTWTAPIVTGGLTGGLASVGTPANITGTLTNPTNTAHTATYTITPTSGTCTGSTFSLIVTVNPRPAVTDMTGTACSASAFTITPTNVINGVVPSGTTYTWSAPVVTGGLTGGVASVGTPANISGTLNNPTNTAQTATYTVTPSSGTCIGPTFSLIVTVNPRPAVTDMTGTFCSASAFTITPANVTNGVVPAGTTYTWLAPIVTGGLTGGLGSVGTPANISGTLNNPTNTSQTATYTVTPSTGTCVGPTFTIIVTVNPRPAATDMTGSACSAEAFGVTPVNVTNGLIPAGTTYSWPLPVVTGGLTGGAPSSGTPANINGTLTNPTNVAQTATYIVTPTSGSCVGATFTVIVTVNPKPAVTDMTATTCNGVLFTTLPVNGVNGVVPAGTTYSWPAPSVTGGMTGGAPGTNAANISGTITNTTNLSHTATYIITPSVGGCSGATFTVIVTVNPGPAVTDMATAVCTGVGFTQTPVNGTNGIVPPTTTYTWPAPVVTGGITGGAASVGTPASITGTLVNPTNTPQTATYSVTPAASGCTGTPFSVTITVNPTPVIANKTATVCSATLFTVSPVNGTDLVPGGTTYSWPIPVVTGGLTGGASGSGAANISATLINPTNTAQTATYIVTPLSGSCTGATFTVIVTVDPVPAVLNMTGIICSELPFTVSPANGINGLVPAGTTYSWGAPVVTGGMTGGTAETGLASITGTLVNSTTAVHTATYSVTPLTGSCTGTPFTVIITVNPLPQTSPITGLPMICETATNQVYQVSLPRSAGSTYAWTVPPSLNITTPPPPSDSYFIIVDATGPSVGVEKIYVTETFTSTTGCVGEPVEFTIVVSPTKAQEVVDGPTPVCEGSTLNQYSVSLTGGSTYSWSLPPGAFITSNPALSIVDVTFPLAMSGQVSVVETNGACTVFHLPLPVTINPRPTLSSSLTPPAVCSGATFNYNATSATGGATFAWTRAAILGINGGTGSAGAANVSEVLTNTTTAPIAVTYVYTTTANGCTGIPQSVVVTVNPIPVLTSTLTPADICSGTTFSYTATSATAGTTYGWSRAFVAGIAQAAGTGAGAGVNETLTNTTTGPLSVTYVYTLTANGCVNSQSVVVIVNPTPVLSSTLTPAAICSGSTFTYTATSATAGATFGWSRAAVAGITEGATTGAVAAVSETLTNTTTAPINVTYVYTITANGCVNTQNVVVTVNPIPVLSSTLTPPAICSGSTFNYTATSATAGATFAWTRALVAGITEAASFGAGNVSEVLTNSTTDPINVTYIYITTANGCSGPPQNVVVTVNPTPVLNSTLTPAAICSGSTFAYTATSATAGATFAWSRATIIGIAQPGSTGIVAAVSETLTNTTTAPINVTYVYTITANGCVNTQSVVVTVNPIPVLNSTLTPPAICSGSTFNYTATSLTAGATFTWSRAAIVGITEGASSGIVAGVSETLTNTTTAPINVTYVYITTANGCVGAPQNVVVVVNPIPVLNSTLTPAAICSGSAFNYTATSSTVGATFSWSRAAVADITQPGTSGVGATVSEVLTNTSTAPISVTYVYTITANGCVNTNSVVVTVNPTPVLNSTLTPAAICSGTTFAYTATSATAGATFAWTRAAVAGITEATTGGIGNVSEVLTNTTAAPINVTYIYITTANGCSGPPQNVVVVVNPTPLLSSTLTPAGICSGSTFSYTATSLTAGSTFIWSRGAVVGISEAPSNGIVAGISETLTNLTTAPINVTYVYTITANGCINTQNVVVTVNPIPVLTSTLTPADICSGTTFSYTATSATPGTSYGWSRAFVAGIAQAAGTGAGAGVNETLTNTTTGPLSVTYVFTLTANGCVNSQSVVVIVNPTPQLNSTLTPAAICSGTTFTYTATSATAGATFGWSRAAVAGITEGATTGAVAAVSEVLTNTTTAPINVTYVYTITANGCVNTQSVVVTVNPTAQVNKPANQVFCNNSVVPALGFTTINTGGTTTYDWLNSDSGIGLPSSGSGSIPSFTAINSGTTPLVATITITPHFTNGTVTCDGPVETFTITVNPTPNVSTASPLTICSATNTNIALTSNVAGATFTWTVGSVTGSISGASASSGSTISQILINSGTTQGQVTYVVTPTANSCTGTPVNIIVTVNPVPNVSTVGPTTICSATATNIALSSSTGGTTFTWTIGTITGAIAGATPDGGALIAQTLTNPGITAGTVEYIVTPIANSCPGIPLTVVVTVNPTPNASTASLTTICSNTATNIALVSNVSGTTFSWTIGAVTGSVSGATASNGSTIAQTLYNSGLAPGSIEYLVTPTANSCPGAVLSIVVTVNPLTGPTSFTSGAMEVCQDAMDETYLAIAANNTSIVYSVLPAAAGVIDPATGVMNWDAAFSGTATIKATSTGLCGTTVGTLSVRVKGLPAITAPPVDAVTCEFGQVNFDVTATGDDLTYLWFVDDNLGGGFLPVGVGVYSGQTSATLQIWSADRTMNNYRYRVEVSGCLPSVTSAEALLTVNTAPELTVHPKDSTICLGAGTVMKAAAVGTGISWNWFVNKGVGGFVPVVPDTHFSFVTTTNLDTTKTTLTITDAQASYNNWIFRAQAIGTCGAPVNTNFGRLSVTNPPSVTLQPVLKVICENGATSFLANGSGYMGLQWQVSTNAGATWTNVVDDALIYVGATTNQLSILAAPVALNGNLYRLAFAGACTTVNSNGVSLTVNPNPIVNFVADINACGGVPVILDGNPSGGTLPYAQHRWTGDVGPLNIYTTQTPTFNSQIAGTYNLNYRVTDSKNCSASDDLVVIVDSPSADFTSDINGGCTPLDVKFTKDMTGIASFSWDFGDGTPAETVVASPLHQFVNSNPTTIGYYNVKLTVRSPGGCEKTYTSLVTVYPAVKATFTASTDTVCSGKTITYTGVPGASKYFWDYGDGISGYAGSNSTHLYVNPGPAPLDLQVKLTTTSFYNCTKDSTITITVMPVPSPQFSAIPVTQIYNAAGNTVTFTNLTNAGNWTYLWNFGDGGTSTLKDPSYTYTNVGTYDVTLEVTNGSCTEMVMHQVSVTPIPPIASFDPIPDACLPLNFTANNTSLNADIPGTTFYWDFGDGGWSKSKNPEYTYFEPGTFRISLTVTGPGGNDEVSQTVHVFATPKAYFEVAPTFVYVNDEQVRAFNLSQGADNYKWEWGDGATSVEKEPYHKYMISGVYDITLWAYKDNGGGNICADKFILSPGVTVEPAGEIRFASVFTPNLDGPIEGPPTTATMDQFFYPPIQEKVDDYKLQIFNRLGVLIFESRNVNVAWNGYYKGKLCPQGVYVWYVEGKYNNGEPFKKVGDITLLH